MDALDRYTWLRERQSGIGASDAPNLVGLGFADAAKVYRDKVTPIRSADVDVPVCGVLARGIALEPLAAALYAGVMDVGLTAPPAAIVRNSEAPWQFASPDRLRQDNGRPVQLKTVAGFGEEWGEPGTDQVPDGYRVQVTQEAGCLSADGCDLAALDVIGWELRVYRVALDRDLFAWLTEVEGEFWREHVAKRVPPSIEWEARFDARKLGLIADRGTRVDLSAVEGAAELFEQIRELKQIKDEAEEAHKAAREKLAAMMGRAERASCGPYTVKKVIVGPQEVPERPAHTKPGYTYLGNPTLRKDKT